MSSPSDDESRSNSEPEYSDGENNGSPEILEAPQAMSKEPVKCPVDTSSDKSTSERTQTDKDTNQVDPSSDKSSSERTQTDKNTNQVDPSSDATLERKVEGQGNKEKQPLQGHHFSEEPIEEHNPEQLNEGHSELDRTSPGPQLQHPRTEQYPGPRSAHGW